MLEYRTLVGIGETKVYFCETYQALARLFTRCRDFLILNETFCWLARPKDVQTRLIAQRLVLNVQNTRLYGQNTTLRLTKSRLFGPIFHSILVWRGEMSVSRGKSSFGEEKVLLARKRSFPRGNTSHWRGTMHIGEERC